MIYCSHCSAGSSVLRFWYERMTKDSIYRRDIGPLFVIMFGASGPVASDLSRRFHNGILFFPVGASYNIVSLAIGRHSARDGHV